MTVVRWLWRLSVATALALLSVSITSAAAVAAPPAAAQIYTYDSRQPPAGLADIATERGPPASHARDITYDAVDLWSHGDSVRPNGPVAGSTTTYDAPPTLAQVARASSTTCGQAGTLSEHPSSLQSWHVAANAGRALTHADLNPSQLSNLTRYTKKLPAGAEPTIITRGADGAVQLSTKVPGRVPGSYATYDKVVDASGTTIDYTKTTVLPDGTILHVKDKLNP